MFTHLVAFHPRPQIASNLGRNVTRSPNPHRNRKRFPSGTKFLAYGRRLKSPSASTCRDLRIASPTRPYIYILLNSPNRNPIRAARAAANRKIAGHKATKFTHRGSLFVRLCTVFCSFVHLRLHYLHSSALFCVFPRPTIFRTTAFIGSGGDTVGKCAGPKWSNDHFGQNDLIPNPIFSICKTKMDQNGPFRSI